MYNIYVEEKRKKELENKQKEEKKIIKDLECCFLFISIFLLCI
jgi:hypothetical protein